MSANEHAPPHISSSRKVTVAGAGSVWSATDAAANSMTLTNGGLTATFTGTPSLYRPLRASISKNSGKLYVEFLCNATGTADNFGLASASISLGAQLGNSNYGFQVAFNVNTVSAGFTSNYTSSQWANPADVVMLAVDFTAGNVWIGKNGGWSNGSNPAAGTLPIISFVPATVGALFPAMAFGNTNDSFTLKPDAASQTYAAPAGFSAWDAAAVVSTSRAAALMIGA